LWTNIIGDSDEAFTKWNVLAKLSLHENSNPRELKDRRRSNMIPEKAISSHGADPKAGEVRFFSVSIL